MKYITTPIYYVNDLPHLGHAYTTFAADIISNYWRQKGEQVFFLTGTDEHGQKVQESAESRDLTPTEYVDEVSKKFQNTWKKLKIKNNFFIRTTDQAHIDFVREFLTDLYRKEEIYKGVYRGLYCKGCEAYLKPEDLDKGVCPDHRQPPEEISEEVYFFKQSQYQRRLIEVLEDGELEIEPDIRENEILTFLKNNKLEDVAITRSKVDWGIEVPWDKNQTIYVWIDALINYLSALKINGKEDFWPADVHFMAKDILRFHGIIWPAMLMAANRPLPKKVFAHGYFTVNGQKMSKTIGNVVDPVDLSHRYPVEAIKYYLFSSFPFGQDGDFDEKEMINIYNSHLADDLGNLVQRTLTMVNKYDVKIDKSFYRFEPDQDYNLAMENLNFFEALKLTQAKVKKLNQLIEDEKPWEFYKKASAASQFDLKTEKRDRFNQIFKELFSDISLVAQNLFPFMPEKSKEIKKQLNDLKPSPIFSKIE
jgi:methionyl-tRNA synthetase